MTWIVIASEAESVEGVEPAVVGMATSVPGSLDDLEWRGAHCATSERSGRLGEDGGKTVS